jgi:hypothetical protein
MRSYFEEIVLAPWVLLDHSVAEIYKYGDLTLQVGGV